MEKFLASMERRAFVMARVATGDAEEAFDIVQDAMLRLVKRYGHKPAEQWRPLFYRILQNCIRDWHRRNAVRSRWRTWLGLRSPEDPAIHGDPLENIADPNAVAPDEAAEKAEQSQQLLAAIAKLPHRQQQAVMLRVWEGLSVADTARAMNCSTGSIKTHTARALRSLRETLTKVEA